MGHEHAGHYKAKHSPGSEPSETLKNEVLNLINDSTITCHEAHKLAEKLNISPAEVGVAIDFCEARITKCQMGLFGYSPEKRIVKALPLAEAREMERMIHAQLENNKLPCIKAWELAKQLGRGKMVVSNAAETLKIKISKCQLGAFN